MDKRPISVAEAKAILARQPFRRRVRNVALQDAGGLVLAAEVYATIDIPAFDQSNMDGWAFAFDGWSPGDPLAIVGRIPAGKQDRLAIGPGEAARIFTGAPLPDGADTVVKQEAATERGGRLHIHQADTQRGDHVRPKGTEIHAGEPALPVGTKLTPGALGFLAGLGLREVAVHAPPSVALVITGDELQQPGQPLSHGQVYEASSVMLRAILAQLGITAVAIAYARDTLDETTRTLATALATADAVLVTGGVSVGDYDFVVEAANRCGVTPLFHRVNQRPGKPLFAGEKDGNPVFGLPGNPSSVLTCFYEYVWPVLRRLMGHGDGLMAMRAPLEHAHGKAHPLSHFLKGSYRDGRVTILPAQASYRMRSFAIANCLVALDETVRDYEAGQTVEIHLLPADG